MSYMDNLAGTTESEFQIGKSGVRIYKDQATNPTSPTPTDGDLYYNTTIDKWMCYDGTRTKWLSVETVALQFSDAGNTAAGSYFVLAGGVRMSATRGWRAPFAGTVVGLQYTRDDTDSATFEAVKGGAAFTPAAEVASTALAGGSTAINSDFAAADILGVRNKSGGNATNDASGVLYVRWRT